MAESERAGVAIGSGIGRDFWRWRTFSRRCKAEVKRMCYFVVYSTTVVVRCWLCALFQNAARVGRWTLETREAAQSLDGVVGNVGRFVCYC